MELVLHLVCLESLFLAYMLNTMNSTFYKYPEIVRLDKRPEILTVKQVVAVEKLHGTNFRVFFPAGMTSIEQVEFGSRNEEFGTGEDSAFYGGRPIEWFKKQSNLLQRMFDVFCARRYSDVIVYGEACGSSIQKGIHYTLNGDVVFRAFDIRVGEAFLSYDLFVEVCDQIGLARSPEIWRGEPSLAAFDALLEKKSVEAERNGVVSESNIMEGVVIRSNPLLRNVFGEWLIIKHKSEKFSEVAKAPSKEKSSINLSVAEDFAQTYVVPGRIRNALGRLRDRGINVVHDMQDMAHLVPAILDDLHKECQPEWDAVENQGIQEKQMRSVITKTLSSVYRRMLLDGLE